MFNDIIVEVVAREQKEAEAFAALGKKGGPLYMSEEALAPFTAVDSAGNYPADNPEHGIYAARNKSWPSFQGQKPVVKRSRRGPEVLAVWMLQASCQRLWPH